MHQTAEEKVVQVVRGQEEEEGAEEGEGEEEEVAAEEEEEEAEEEVAPEGEEEEDYWSHFPEKCIITAAKTWSVQNIGNNINESSKQRKSQAIRKETKTINENKSQDMNVYMSHVVKLPTWFKLGLIQSDSST